MVAETARVVLRADAGPAIGAGHLFRSIALGRALADRGASVHVATRTDDPALLDHIRDEGLQLLTLTGARGAAEVDQLLASGGSNAGKRWAIVDGYGFGKDYLSRLARAGVSVGVIDDQPRLDSYDVELLIDQNLGALRHNYRGASRLLLGPRFLMLRRDVVAAAAHPRVRSARPRVFVTMGAADVGAHIPHVIRALAVIPNIEMTVVLGSANPAADSIATKYGSAAIRFVHHARQLAALAVEHDLAVATVGVTSWELACLGVPTLLISSTDVQQRVAAVAAEYGAHRWIGHGPDVSEDCIRREVTALIEDEARSTQMIRRGRLLADGQGAQRVADAILATPANWCIRPADTRDVEPIWEIASSPDVRQMAFDPTSFDFPTHEAWFSRRLASGDSRMWVAERDGTVGGFVRYDRHGDCADIDIAVASMARGRGLGSMLLTRTVAHACRELGVQRVRGVVLAENLASQRTFIKASFIRLGPATHQQRDCIVFETGVAS